MARLGPRGGRGFATRRGGSTRGWLTPRGHPRDVCRSKRILHRRKPAPLVQGMRFGHMLEDVARDAGVATRVSHDVSFDRPLAFVSRRLIGSKIGASVLTVDWGQISRFTGQQESPGFRLWRDFMRWQRGLNTVLRSFGLTQPQFAVLATCGWLTREDKPISQKRLVDFLQFDRMHVSQVASRLEANGLIARCSAERPAREASAPYREGAVAEGAVGFGRRHAKDRGV
jgi:MarR family